VTNTERFKAALTLAYQDLFATDEEYAYAAARTTPEALAEKMTSGLLTGSANHDGTGIRRACKAVGIKHTRKAIVAFLQEQG
jgi:hypothetical protein